MCLQTKILNFHKQFCSSVTIFIFTIHDIQWSLTFVRRSFDDHTIIADSTILYLFRLCFHQFLSSIFSYPFHLIQRSIALSFFANYGISAHSNVARCDQNKNKKFIFISFVLFLLLFFLITNIEIVGFLVCRLYYLSMFWMNIANGLSFPSQFSAYVHWICHAWHIVCSFCYLFCLLFVNWLPFILAFFMALNVINKMNRAPKCNPKWKYI